MKRPARPARPDRPARPPRDSSGEVEGAAPIPRGLSPAERAVVREVSREAATRPAGEPEGSEAHKHEAARIENLFRLYLEEILGWTRDSNLVARGDVGRLASRHLVESIAVLPVLDRLAARSLIDLGSGAGFPAIPIQIARPDLKVTLVESRRRKGLFLGRVVQGLELDHARVLTERAEHVQAEGEQAIGQFDVGTARAVAPAAELLTWLAPLVRPGGHAVLFKGSSYAEELRAWEAAETTGGTTRAWKHVEVIPVPDRHLYFAVFERLPG